MPQIIAIPFTAHITDAHLHVPCPISEAHALVEEGERLRDIELELAQIEHELATVLHVEKLLSDLATPDLILF